MRSKYINCDKSIVEYMYNLDNNNRKVFVLYLLKRMSGYNPMTWGINLAE